MQQWTLLQQQPYQLVSAALCIIEMQLLLVYVYTESTLPTFTEPPAAAIGETCFSKNHDHIINYLCITRNNILNNNLNMWVKELTIAIYYYFVHMHL